MTWAWARPRLLRTPGSPTLRETYSRVSRVVRPQGNRLTPGGPRPVLQGAGRCDAGAIEPLVLEDRLEPGTHRRGGERIPALVVRIVGNVPMLADVLPSEDDPGRLDAGVYAVAGAVGEVARGVRPQDQVRDRPVRHPGHAQGGRVGVGGDVLAFAVEDAGRDRGASADARSRP